MSAPVRILHIDDNPLDAELVTMALEIEQEKLPTVIQYVQTREEYLAALERKDFDLILSDYRMGTYDGDQALAVAKEQCPDIPFIMVTGELGEEMVIETLKRGATDYVLKDRIFRLVPAIQRALAEADLQRRQRIAEESLRESQRTLALAVDATKLGLFDYNPQTGELIWNALAKEHFGLPPNAHVTFELFVRGLHPDDRDRVQHAVDLVLSGRGSSEYHIEYRTIGLEDGRERWLNARGQVVFDGNRKAVRFIGATADITEAKRIQEEIRRAHQDKQEVLESVQDALYGLDRNWCFIYVNPKAEQLLRKTRAELLGRTLWDLFPQVIGSESEKRLRRTMTYRIPDIYETRSAVNGAWIEVLLSPKADGGISVMYRDIRERKAQEQALRLSEERFSAAFRGSPYPEVISRIADGVFLDVNDATLSFYGMSREEMLGHSSFELGILVDTREREELVKSLLRDGTVQDFPMHVKTRYRGERLVHLAASILKSTKEGAMLIVLRDVTAELQAQNEVTQSLRRTSEVLESIQDAFYAVDSKKRITYVNRHAEVAWGKPKEELLGKSLWEVFPEAVGTPAHSTLEHAWQERTAVHTEWFSPIIHSWVEAHLYPTADGGLSVYFRDISERKRAEEALQKSEERLRVTFEKAPLGLVEIDARGHFVAVNERICQMLGYRKDELLGMNVSDITAKEDLEVSNRMNALIRESTHERVAYKKRYRKKDGTHLWVKVTISVLHNVDGAFTGAIGTIEDISEGKGTGPVADTSSPEAESPARDSTEPTRAESEILRLNEELEERVRRRTSALERANKELEGFSYSVSHDLKAPLRLINGFVELIAKQGDHNLTAKQRQFLSTIREQATRMEDLIKALLEFSRITRKEPTIIPVDTSKLVREVIDEQRRLTEETSTKEVLVEVGDLPIVQADRILLRMVFTNLLSNAFKFTRTVPEPRITIDAARNHEYVHFRIADNGVGFPREQAERLFGVFQRLHGAGEFEGTGIGLANVRKIVERHGGQVCGDGEEGRGAVFLFTLPASPEAVHHLPGS